MQITITYDEKIGEVIQLLLHMMNVLLENSRDDS